MHYFHVVAAGCMLFSPALHAAVHAASGAPSHRAALALAALLGGFALCLYGWEWLDRRRHLRGAAMIVAGIAFGIGALSLLRLNALPQTWDWWI